MIGTHQNRALATKSVAYGRPNGEVVIVAHRSPVKIPSLQQLREVFAISDALNEKENQVCNRATD
jgi:hypothetical protein